jgi:hypothetical protein
VKLRGSGERDNNQEVSDQRTNERVLPGFGVAKSLHHRHFKHVVGRGKAIVRFD